MSARQDGSLAQLFGNSLSAKPSKVCIMPLQGLSGEAVAVSYCFLLHAL